ncbi:MAG TPA: thiamine pyrophosphate-dependent enzyme [Candidatus Thermoplasmatota archaeon]|nr:thiamine pyrophosphate-dependent enzyme [Candidatus Thermoplasmatota archaeon]
MTQAAYQILAEDGRLTRKDLPAGLTDKDLVAMHRAMLTTRTLDNRCMLLQRQGRLGFYGASQGEEGATIGSGYAFRPTDWVFPALRQSGILLMRGWPLEKYFHHMFGTAHAVEKGRSMPMHFSDRQFNFVTWSSSMATQLLHAAGAAYAAKVKGEDTVMAGYLGDGASSEGDFHCAMNFAGVWKLPMVFVCQNNQWAISVPFKKQTASDGIAVKAQAYGFEGVRVDGNDILAVYEVTKKAVDKARSGGGPTLIEAVTYRMQGHSSSDDPTRYRDAAEVQRWAERDPIVRFERFLTARGLLTPQQKEALEAEINAAITTAIEVAEKAPPPAFDTLIQDVFREPTPRLVRDVTELKEIRGMK